MYVYPTLIRFSKQYLLYVKLIDIPINETLVFELEANGTVIHSMKCKENKKEKEFVFHLDQHIWEQKDFLRLYYTRNNKKYYVDSIKQYKNYMMNEDIISYSIMDFYKKELIKKILGD